MLDMEEFKVLSYLMQEKCITEYYSKTRSEIVQSNNISDSKVYRCIKKLKALNYITEGYKNEKKKTYYLTEQGMKLIVEKLLLKEK